MRNLLLSVFFTAAVTTADAVNYSYDAAGRLIKADYGNGKSIAYTYDKAGNLLKREVVSGAASPASTVPETRQRPRKIAPARR
ncbi:MAG: RHS repeat domain-containing protein [Bryobacteraceae bacterium]